jgi:tRNA threonylcarbamoyl adenosine modification protein YeaZ
VKRLLIDTSSEHCIIALAEEKALILQTVFIHKNELARSLLTQIQALIQKVDWSLQDLTEIAIGVGPGSYTGTRAGAATARALAFSLRIPLRGFCSLIAFLPPYMGHFASILAAKSGLFYLAKGEKSAGYISLNFASLITKDELCTALATVDFATARCQKELPCEVKKFFPFHPDPENIIWALQAPLVFPFEKEVQLIYLHSNA